MSLMSSPVTHNSAPAPETDPGRAHAAAATLLTWVGLFIGAATTRQQVTLTDFPVDMIIYRRGVEAFLSGAEMYSQPMHAGDLALPFIYPPFGALVMVPLSFDAITDDMAGDIMIVLSNVLILACIYVVLRAAMAGASRGALRMTTAVSWAFAVSIEPVELNNGFAQLNIVLMALVVLDLAPYKRRFLPQGILIGIAAAIKLTPLAFGLYWLLRRDFRSMLIAAASAVGFTLLAALFRFDATREFYFSTLMGMGTGAEIGVDTTYQSNSSLKGMLMRWAPDKAWLDAHGTLINGLWLVLVVATIVLGGWLMIALLRRGMRIDAVLVNAMIMLLVSPVSWSHHWIWLSLIIPVFAWRAVTLLNTAWVSGAVLAVWTWFLLTTPPKWWYGDDIDVFVLSAGEKIMVSDFVWLAVLLMVGVALGLRRVPVEK